MQRWPRSPEEWKCKQEEGGGRQAQEDGEETPVKQNLEDLLAAVKQIGYPSQILHAAQLNKLALRDLNNLIKAVSG